MRLDDLASAFRSVFGNFDTEPGVTIDPNPENPRSDQMLVRFFGGMENTHFGYRLFEADRLMKALSLGEDNVTHQKTTAHVEGHYNLLDLSFSNLGRSHNEELWSRFWLIPEKVIVRVSDDKKSITFPDTRIRVKTETMRWKNGKLVPAKGEKDEKAEYFAAHFTKFYDDYASEFPVYQELKNMTNIVGFFKWLKAAGINIDLEWLNKYDKKFETPKTTPSLTVNGERRNRNGVERVSIFGGTDLTINNMYVKDDGTSSRYAEKAIQSVASTPGVATATFVDKDKRKKGLLPCRHHRHGLQGPR